MIPARVEATLNFRYAPDRTRRGGRGAAARALGRDAEITSNSPPAHVALRSPLVERAARRRRLRRRAEAGLDERRRLRGPRPRRASTSGPARRASPTPPTSGSRSPSSSAPSTRCSASSPVRLSVQLSPVLADLAQYPFARLDDWKAEASRPRDRADRLRHGRPARARRPRSSARRCWTRSTRSRRTRARSGCPSCASAVAGWIDRRFGVDVDPDREIVPTLGSKEAIFSFAQIALGEKRVVAIPEPAYPVYERGALFAGGCDRGVPLREEHGWLPDLDAFDAWDEIALFWVCYPNNPTGADAPLSFYEELAARAREHGFLLCSDEAYSELWFDEPPVSALQVADRTNVVVFNTLSKRSSMTGLPLRASSAPRPRSPTRCAASARRSAPRRRSSSSARRSPPGRTTRTSRTCARSTARKRETLLPALEAQGLRLAGVDATFYLWLAVGGPSEAFARRLLEHGVVCAPGSFFGPAGEGYVRFALVPTQERVRARSRDRASGACDDRGDDRRPRPRRGARRRAGRRRLARQRRRSGGDPRLLPRAADGAERGRAVRVPRQDPAQVRLRGARRARRAAGSRALRGVPLARGRADAVVREHRRLGRPEHDGRHLGDGRLGRADRRQRPPGRRRRDRRRARAARRAARDRRGRRVHRLPLRSSSRASASAARRCSRRT